MRKTLVIVAFLCTCCALWAGYTHKYNRPIRSIDFNVAEKHYNTSSGTTSVEDAIRKARDFAAAAIAFCSSSGGGSGVTGAAPPDLDAMLAALNEAILKNRFCQEGVEEMADKYLATTNGDDPIPGTVGTSLEFHSSDGSSPGINLSPRLFPPTIDIGSLPYSAMLASILMHEAGHIAADHDSGTDNPELLAYELEAEFICCALSYAATLPNAAAITAVLCARLQSVANSYYCIYGGTGVIACAECTLLAIYCENIAPSAPTASPSLPRPPVDPCSQIMDVTYYSTVRGLFEASLMPCRSELHIAQWNDSGANQWQFDISAQNEGVFQPMTMVAGGNAEVYVAGVLQASGHSAIYRLDFGWSGSSPSISTTLIYSGQTIGDILGIEYVKQLNNKLAVFDYTNASVWYVDTANSVPPILVANSVGHPALLDVQSMGKRSVKWGLTSPKEPALVLIFQESQKLNLNSTNGTVFTLLLTDVLGDGSIDDEETVLL